VTQQEVKEQIARGELGGMSWRGLVVVDFELDPKTNTTVRVLKDIDLFEISVTHIPDHNQSTFIVGKMVDGNFEEVEGVSSADVQLWQVRLEKTKFASIGMATEYLKAHKLDYSKMREDEDSYFAQQQPADHFQLEKTVRIKMGDAYMLMAPPKEPPKPELGTSRLVAEMVDVAKSHLLEEANNMADEKTKEDATATDAAAKAEVEKKAKQADLDAAAEEEKAKKAKKAKAAELEVDKTDKEKSVSEQQLDVLSSHVASGVADALKPSLEGIAGGMTAMGDGLSKLTETVAKMALGAQGSKSDDTDIDSSTNSETEKEEVAKSANAVAEGVLQSVVDSLSDLTTRMDAQQVEVVEIAKSAIALGESIPNKGVERDEKVDVAKSADDDKNACLDSAFPFFTE
jgi:hypothetical protein